MALRERPGTACRVSWQRFAAREGWGRANPADCIQRCRRSAL